MEPGYGAEEQASRRARRLAERRREAEAAGATSAEVAKALEAEQRRVRAWSAGAEGERQVAAALDTLRAYGWVALHDLHWPGRRLANVDHIAIGPGGVVVLDAKNWSGDVRLVDGVLKQNGYRRDREVEGVAALTAEITALLAPQHRSAVVGMICLAGQDQPHVRTAGGVGVVGRLQVASTLVGMPPRLSPYDVADIGRFLAAALGAQPLTAKAVRRRLPRAAGPSGAAGRRGGTAPSRAPRRGSSRRQSQRNSAAGALARLGLVLVALWLFLQLLPRLAGG